MKYKRRRRLYSQNFLCTPELTRKLIGRASIGKKDTVLEIGPGKGVMTNELLKVAGKVIAVELDYKFCLHLKKRFYTKRNFELHHGNFLKFPLPPNSYKVFSNIPFGITAGILRKLTEDENMLEAYLIIQKQAVEKFAGMPYDSKNSMIAILLKPWFETNILWEFKRSDFVPQPSVNVVLMRILRIKNPMISKKYKELYRDFVVYSYTRGKVDQIRFAEWVERFDNFARKASKREKGIVANKAKKFLENQRTKRV